jgi:hypothetical protein
MPPTKSPSFAVKLGLKTKPTKPLCHYTSQNGLIGILKSKAMYATDAAYLNDSQEVIYAINLAKEYFKNHHTKDPRFMTEVAKILEKADGHAGGLPVYVASFSEEPDLLSQWRGYCPNGPGFALSLSADRMMTLAQTHDWEIFKCIYDEDEQVEVLKRMLDEAVSVKSPLKGFPTEVAFGLLLLSFASVFKHPKFSEESEWRATKRTGGTPFAPPGKPAIPSNVRPGGSTLIPYIPFRLTPKPTEAIELAQLIVGPTPHPSLAVRAVNALLSEYKVDCAEVRSSEIPFRNW